MKFVNSVRILAIAAMSLLPLEVSAICFTVGGISPSSTYDTYWTGGTEPIPTPEPFYKNEFQKTGPVEEGDWAGMFDTEWGTLDSDGEPFSARITWGSGFNFELTGIWLKDGVGEWYAVDVSGFSSTAYDCIELFSPTAAKAISHVTLIGNDVPSVPDGGTTASLLGLAILGLGWVYRRKV